MPLEEQVDLANFAQDRNDKLKIEEDGLWVPCRICQEVFMRVRLTGRYCNTCCRAFCEGEHGNFAGRVRQFASSVIPQRTDRKSSVSSVPPW